jgi:cell division protein FtsQ
VRLDEERREEQGKPEAGEVVVLPETEPVRVERRLPRWARWALAPVVAMVLLGAAFVFGRSSFFAIDAIDVVGTSHLTPARAIHLAGVERGANALSVDLGAAEARLERDPWVASATVERSLPGTITIRVTERTPVLAVEREGAFDLIGADGVVVVSRASAGRLPIATFSAALSQPPTADIAGVVAALDPAARDEVASVEVDALGAITLELRSGATVRFGTPTDLETKVDALEAMLRFADDDDIRFASIDLRFPSAPSAVLGNGSRYEP